jgi:LacI family transcriptional regulator
MLMRNDGVFEVATPVRPSQGRLGTRRVGLLIDQAAPLRGGVLKGISEYLRQQDAWSIHLKAGDVRSALAGWMREYEVDGVLLLSEDQRVEQILRRAQVPCVTIGSAVASVHVDETQVGQLAARHLLDCGLRQFAVSESTACAESFEQEVAARGFRCWKLRADLIEELPKPIGVLAGSDEEGIRIIELSASLGYSIPQDVSVIGVGNDQPICELATPALSSVDVNPEMMGYEAAALLDRMMEGDREAEPIEVLPRGVVARRSTDSAASEDEEIARAIRYIRNHACEGLQVSDVLAHMAMSRGSLGQRMKQVMGRTIHQEIHRVRLDRAKELLVSSDLAVKQVAKESGFASVQYMTRVFRSGTGETPASYRRRRMR